METIKQEGGKMVNTIKASTRDPSLTKDLNLVESIQTGIWWNAYTGYLG